MFDILARAGCFVAIILLGYGLRRVGFFKKEDFYVISKIVIKITLTAAIVNNFAGREIPLSMLLLMLLGLGFGVLTMLAGYLLHAHRGREAQAFGVLNISGCNIGNFAMPFAQSFLGPVGVMAASLFDTGNSFICLGGAYGVASMVKQSGGRFSAKPILKALISSAPFLAYIGMTTLCLLHITLPGPMVELASIIGNSNAFMAMLMIGVGFDLGADKANTRDLVRILALRYAMAVAFALVCYFVLPLPLEYRQALVIVAFSPIASAAPGYTAQMDSDFGLASAVNSFSILISIVLITGALVLVL